MYVCALDAHIIFEYSLAYNVHLQLCHEVLDWPGAYTTRSTRVSTLAHAAFCPDQAIKLGKLSRRCIWMWKHRLKGMG